jgi:hypothetical protein
MHCQYRLTCAAYPLLCVTSPCRLRWPPWAPRWHHLQELASAVHPPSPFFFPRAEEGLPPFCIILSPNATVVFSPSPQVSAAPELLSTAPSWARQPPGHVPVAKSRALSWALVKRACLFFSTLPAAPNAFSTEPPNRTPLPPTPEPKLHLVEAQLREPSCRISCTRGVPRQCSHRHHEPRHH